MNPLSVIAFGAIALSLALTVLGMARRGWRIMLVAALGSTVFSVLGILSIGAWSAVLTCVQLALAVALWLTRDRSALIAGLFYLSATFAGTFAWWALIGRALPPFLRPR